MQRQGARSARYRHTRRIIGHRPGRRSDALVFCNLSLLCYAEAWKRDRPCVGDVLRNTWPCSPTIISMA
eukprot:4704233-Prymnesium_polylepis.1